MKGNKPEVRILLFRSQVNAILSALSCFRTDKQRDSYGTLAETLTKHITKFSYVQKAKADEEETVTLHLFKREAAGLISLLSVYIYAMDGEPDDLLTALKAESTPSE